MKEDERERGRERGEMYCRGLDRLVYLSFVIPHDFCPEAARRTNTLAHTPAVDKDVHLQCTVAIGRVL